MISIMYSLKKILLYFLSLLIFTAQPMHSMEIGLTKNKETFKVLLFGVGCGIALSGFGFFLCRRFAAPQKQQSMPVADPLGQRVKSFVDGALLKGEKLTSADDEGYFKKIVEWSETRERHMKDLNALSVFIAEEKRKVK